MAATARGLYLEMAAGDCTPYAFNKQLVFDIEVHLQQLPSDTMVINNPNSSKGNRNIDISALYLATSVTRRQPGIGCSPHYNVENLRCL